MEAKVNGTHVGPCERADMNLHDFKGLPRRRRSVPWWRWLMAGAGLAVLVPTLALCAVVSVVVVMIVVTPMLALLHCQRACRTVPAFPPPVRNGQR
jgi:hypothetical protein